MTTLEADLPYVVGKYLESVLLQLSAQANYPRVWMEAALREEKRFLDGASKRTA
jgi:hypothetical protein